MERTDQKGAPFAMPALKYDKGALAPWVSAETIEYHYGKHLQTYVNNLNALVAPGAAGAGFVGVSLEEIVKKAPAGPVFNNAAQVWNHTLYFMQMAPAAGGDAVAVAGPKGKLLEAMVRDFGSVEAFREKFAAAAMGLFGSGWTWLAADKPGGKLEIVNAPNAGNPLTEGKMPLMVLDVWEHAYYIDHRNARAASVEAFWKVLDWGFVERRY